MAEVQPLRALRYDLRAVGSLDAVVSPPYDVIDDATRAELASRSPFNVVEIDLPREGRDGDPYVHAETTVEAWRQQGVLVQEAEPALWALTQEYTGLDGRAYTRHGLFARVRIEDYGTGRIRPHERTHPGPKEDRLRLTRATRANLSPIFSLFPDPEGAAWRALEPATVVEPFATTTGADGAISRLWRVGDPQAIAAVQDALADAELLIADGHHRYETARVYAREMGGEGEHSYVLMLLCSLSDPGLTVFAIHRVLAGLEERHREALRNAILSRFDVERVDPDELEPPPEAPGIAFGYMDTFHREPYRLTLEDHSVVDAALADKPDPYRRLDTAVLEAVLLRGALEMTDDDIRHLRGLCYTPDAAEARKAIESGSGDAAFFMRPTPVELVREVAAAGESMPPKSTYFFPKVPTGLLFNPLV